MARKHEYVKEGISRREFLAFTGVGLGSALAFSRLARGSPKWPERPITAVIEYSAGGGTDTITRAEAGAMEKILRATINCTNMPGSTGALATKFVWGKPSDGYWWLGAAEYNRALRTLGYSDTVPWKDWQFYKAANSIQGWAVRPDSPFKDLGDLIDAAKKKPGKILVSNSGIGDVWHVGSILVKKATGVKWEEIPYKGGAPATLALLQKEVEVCASGVHEQVEFLRAGKLRNLAVFTDKPLEVEGVGTLNPVTKFVPEVGSFAPWGGIYTLGLKRDVPVEILKKVKETFLGAMDDPNFNKVLEKRVIFKNPKVGADADREAAVNESVVAWVFWDIKLESAKVNPKGLGIPRPEEFEKWWPPKDYKPRI
jgi:tripartite-type tricarboxylate transporter receptor subunit TctC